ncbi:hypothetical protein D3C76_1464190 [compost metagenome]|nr:hypothetical protein PS687_05710 [Pseudomonas fluorescens]
MRDYNCLAIEAFGQLLSQPVVGLMIPADHITDTQRAVTLSRPNFAEVIHAPSGLLRGLVDVSIR